MFQKIIQVGKLRAVTLPRRYMEDLDLKVGDKIELHMEKKSKAFSLIGHERLSGQDKAALKIALDLLHRYQSDFKALAHK